MDSISPEAVCTAGNNSHASGALTTPFGFFGKLMEEFWQGRARPVTAHRLPHHTPHDGPSP